MNELFIFDSSKGVLRQKAQMEKPYLYEQWESLTDTQKNALREDFNTECRRYYDHVCSLKFYRAPRGFAEDGRELVEDIDFSIVRDYDAESDANGRPYGNYEYKAVPIHKKIPKEAPVGDQERILCAAIWYLDLPTQKMPPKNIDKGVVVCGQRHGHCIDIMVTLANLRTVQNGERSVGATIQGFLTNKNRFVDRQEGANIAFAANQIPKTTNRLFSEDLY